MRRTLLVMSILMSLSAMLLPSAGAAEVRGDSERYFMRWDAPGDGSTSCGTDRYLSTRAGGDDVVCTQIYATAVTNVFPGRDIPDFTLDALDNVTGRIELGPAVGLTYGVAVVDVTVSVDAVIPGELFGSSLGSETRSIVLTPATSDASFAFDFDTPDELDGKTVTDLSFTINIAGPQALPWDFNLNGASFFDVPFIEDVQ